MSQNMKLEVLLSAINKATGPLKQITKGSTETAKALKAARDNLRALNDQQKNIDGFRKLDKDIAISNNALKAATERIKQLKLEMAAVEKPTAAMTREFNKAVTQAGKLKQEHTDLITKQQQLRSALHGAGMDTKNLAEHQRTLKTNLATATVQISKQTEALKKQSDIAARMNAAKRARDEGLDRRNAIAGAGASSMAAGVAMGAPIVKTIKDYAAFETAMLGVARQVNDARDANGKLTPTYYEMGDAIKNMSERLPLTAIEIAQLVEGAARMGIQGKQNLLIFTEQAAIMSAAFDLPTDKIAEDMGMISGLYKIPIKNIHEFGDAINWLDDNAQSKGGEIIDVMKRIAGTATSAGMDFKQAAALGSTFLSLGSSAEIAATASNAMINRLGNAPILASSARYAGGLKMLGLEAAKLQKAMSSDATGTILDVLDRIKALPKDKQLEAATRLFGVEYGDDAAKLAQNLEEYRRQLKLTQDARAAGSMNRESASRNESLDAQYQMSTEAIANTSREIGEQLKPALVDILVLIKDVSSGIRAWVKEHPVLTGFIVKTIAAIAILSVGIGGLLLTVAAIMGPFIALRFGLAFLGVKATWLVSIFRFLNITLIAIPAAFMAGYAAGTILAKGIDNWLSSLLGFKTSLGELIFNVVEAFKNGDWRSIGRYIVLGIEAGLDMASFGLYSKVKGLVKDLSSSKDFLNSSGANTLVTTGPNNSSTQFNNDLLIKPSKPLKPSGASGSWTDNRQQNFNIHPAPGMNEKQLAKAVADEVAKNNNAAAARGRSTLRDRE